MKIKYLVLILITFIFSGCSYFALFSQEVALDRYHRVGIVSFTSDSKGNLNKILTQTFLKEIRKATKKALIIELGEESKLLEAVNEKEMNPAAIAGIAKKYDLDAILTGKMVIHEITPQTYGYKGDFSQDNIPGSYRTFRIKFDIDASLSVNLIDAKNVITVWSNSARERKTVTPVNTHPIKDTIGISFDEKAPEEAHKGLSNALVQDIIHKLRVKHL